MDPKYRHGISTLDEQHATLIQRIEDLHSRIGLGTVGDVEIMELQDFLVSYTEEHFAYEESLMRKYSYPGTEDHIKKHEWMRGYILEITSARRFDAAGIAFDLLMALNSWLVRHIMSDDLTLANYLISSGFNDGASK